MQSHTTFFDQSDAWLSEMERSILQLTVAPDQRAWLRAILGTAHEIKDCAAAFDTVPRVALTAHMLEDAVGEIMSREMSVNPVIIGVLLDAKDVLKAQLDRYRHGLDQDDAAFRRICSTLRSVCDLGSVTRADRPRELLDPRNVAGLSPKLPAPAVPGGTAMGAQSCMTIATGRLMELEALGCELANAQRILARASTALDAVQHSCILKSLDTLACRTRALQLFIRGIRMESLACLFGQCSRVAQDVALLLTKAVEVKTSGETIELERQVVQALHDSLIMLVRHSVTHGIECSALRVAAGKPAVGRLMLSAERFTQEAVIEVCDDGAGQSNEQVLDHARQSVAALGGRFSVECFPGQGTTVRVGLPLAMAPVDQC